MLSVKSVQAHEKLTWGTWGKRGMLTVPNTCGCCGHKHVHSCCCDSIPNPPLVRFWEQPQNREFIMTGSCTFSLVLSTWKMWLISIIPAFLNYLMILIRKGFCWRWSAHPCEAEQWGIFLEPGSPRPFSQQRGWSRDRRGCPPRPSETALLENNARFYQQVQ